MINKLEQVHIQSSVAGSKIVLHTPKTQYAAGFLTFKKKKKQFQANTTTYLKA
jgi:hypothetical protein